MYSNLDAAPHPALPSAIATRLGAHLASPVRFGEMVEAMYRDGTRVFIEVGPGSVLTPLVASVLGDRPHLALCRSAGRPRRSRRLAAVRWPAWPSPVFRFASIGSLATASARILDLQNLPSREDQEPTTASTWLVSGSRARPINDPEISRLGQGPVLPSPAPERSRRSPTNRHQSPSSRRLVAGREPLARVVAQPLRPITQTETVPSSPLSPPRPKRRSGNIDNHETSNAPTHATRDRVIESFQQTMRAFLEVERSTMLAYLSGRGAAAPPPAPSLEPGFERSSPESPPPLAPDAAAKTTIAPAEDQPNEAGAA